jgi:N-acetylglucosaminyl-diphospho-decaprenol L-rhamnosyltransferase
VSVDSQVVRVVCVVYNPGDELLTFARSLGDATAREVDLLIVNNGQRSDIVDAVAAEFDATCLTHPQGNVGYGRAANLGAAHPGRDYDWLVVANPDIAFEVDCLDAIIAEGEADGSAAALGPRVLNEDGTIYPSARALPSLPIGVGHALLHRIWPGNPWSRDYRQAETALGATTAQGVGWLSGACLVLRPSAFAEVGGFDRRYFMFFEDVDLGDRLGQAGWRNVYVPAARVTHAGGTSWRSSPVRMIRAHHTSARRYLFGRYSRWYLAPLRAAIASGLWVREQVEIAIVTREHRREDRRT